MNDDIEKDKLTHHADIESEESQSDDSMPMDSGSKNSDSRHLETKASPPVDSASTKSELDASANLEELSSSALDSEQKAEQETEEPKQSDPLALLKTKTRRSLLVGAIAVACSVAGWKWLFSRSDKFGLAWPLRNTLEGTGTVLQTLIPPKSTAPEFARVTDRPPRKNGAIGLSDAEVSEIGIVNGIGGDAAAVKTITLSSIHDLPMVEQTIEFKCIEGWSEVMTFAGARFADFLEKNNLGRRADGSWYPYVGLETPDGEYYVSLDMESMLHPQTLLAYKMNGEDLSAKNGAPLRLCVAVKYGIKNLKQIGKIRFANERPADYWHEQGYDWYSSL